MIRASEHRDAEREREGHERDQVQTSGDHQGGEGTRREVNVKISWLAFAISLN